MPNDIENLLSIEPTLLLQFTNAKTMANLSITSKAIQTQMIPFGQLITRMGTYEKNQQEIEEISDELTDLDDNYFCAEYVDPKIQYEYFLLSKKRKALMAQQPLKKPRVKL